MLERAWNESDVGATTLIQKLQDFQSAFASRADDGIANQSQNGHSSGAFLPGANAPADSEVARGWRRLIDLYRQTRQFLRTASKYGFDAFDIKDAGQWPSFPAALADANQVIVDDEDRWADLIDQYSVADITAESVIGQLVSEGAIFLWIMDNLFPITESRGDYSMAIVGRGGMQFT